MRLSVKICGVRAPDIIEAAAAGGARAIGLVFYPKSPRSVGPMAAAQLSRLTPTTVRVVGLFVDPTDEDMDDIVDRVPLDLLQLHGSETLERVASIREAYGIPVMKAIRVADAADLDRAKTYEAVADWLLFDAKPPANVASLPGGTGLCFDWTLLTGRAWSVPWMLAGGLRADTLAEAVRTTGAAAVDVSSGIESRPGVKDPDLVAGFLATAGRL